MLTLSAWHYFLCQVQNFAHAKNQLYAQNPKGRSPMRITKVSVDKKDVTMQRDVKEGYLCVGGEEKRGFSKVDEKSIDKFIRVDKRPDLSLSLQNSIVVGDNNFDNDEEKEKKRSNLKALKQLFGNFILKQLGQDKEYNIKLSSLRGLLEADFEECLKCYFKRKPADAEYSDYVLELKKAVSEDRFTKESLPKFKAWIHKRLNRIEKISKSINKNKIDITINYSNENSQISSKRKQFLKECFADIEKFIDKLGEASILYKLNELCKGLQDISIWYDKEKDKKEKLLGKKYKEHLQREHQPKIFGTRDNPKNRDDRLLYVYHSEFVAYLDKKFPLKQKNEYEEEYIKTFLDANKIHAILSQQIRNKLVQHLISNGKLVHEKIEAKQAKNESLPVSFTLEELNADLDSALLQTIKIKETFKRSLSDCIVFAANNLKNEINYPYLEDDFLSKNDNTKTKLATVLNAFPADQKSLLGYQHDALYTLRNAIFHVQNVKQTGTNASDQVKDRLIKDIDNLPNVFIEKFANTGVLKYYNKEVLEEIFQKPLEIDTKTEAFAPSFYNVLERARGLEKSWAPPKISKELSKKDKIAEKKENLDIEQIQARSSAQSYLLETIYYQYFLKDFFSQDVEFKKVVDNILAPYKNKDNKLGGYSNFPYYNVGMGIGTYLAEIQSMEQDTLHKQSKRKNKEQKNKEQPYYQRFIRDIFAEGFSNFIANKRYQISKQLKNIEVNDISPDNYVDYISIIKINTDEFNENNKLYKEENYVFYAWLLLLDAPHINILKGNILKYQQAQKSFGFNKKVFTSQTDWPVLINIRMQYTALPKDTLGEDNSKLLEKLSRFVDFSFDPNDVASSLDSLRNLEPKGTGQGERTQVYLAGNQVIPKRALAQVHKNHTEKLFGKLIISAQILHEDKKENIKKVTAGDCKKFYNLEKTIAETYKQKELLRVKWLESKNNHTSTTQKLSFTNTDAKQYEWYCISIDNYIWRKNFVELVHINQLSSLVQSILSNFISMAYLFERDMYYMVLAMLNTKGAFNEKIEKELKKDKSKLNFFKIIPKDTKAEIFKILGFTDNNFDKIKQIRNYLAHEHYTRCVPSNDGQNYSILDMLYHLRSLVAYDRKLKNAVAKSFIDLLAKHGIVVEFEPLHTNGHKFVIKKCEPKKIQHLGGAKFKGNDGKDKTIETDAVHEDYAKMVEALLKFKP